MVRVRRLAAAVPDHSLDLEGHGERPEIFGLGQDHSLAGPGAANRPNQMKDLELERVVFVHLDVLDEGSAPVADRLTVERVLLRRAAVDPDVLLGVIQNDVGVRLRDREGPS